MYETMSREYAERRFDRMVPKATPEIFRNRSFRWHTGQLRLTLFLFRMKPSSANQYGRIAVDHEKSTVILVVSDESGHPNSESFFALTFRWFNDWSVATSQTMVVEGQPTGYLGEIRSKPQDPDPKVGPGIESVEFDPRFNSAELFRRVRFLSMFATAIDIY
jgi:hypothetical protein